MFRHGIHYYWIEFSSNLFSIFYYFAHLILVLVSCNFITAVRRASGFVFCLDLFFNGLTTTVSWSTPKLASQLWAAITFVLINRNE